MTGAFRVIGLAGESESPENPGGLDKRVALIPRDVSALVEHGCTVFVEHGAGLGLGITDGEYEAVGACVRSADEIYSDKDLVIKFKGPSLDAIDRMTPGSTMLCMAHVASFPERLARFRARSVGLVALEEIVESPEVVTDSALLGTAAMSAAIDRCDAPVGSLDIFIAGFSEHMQYAIREAANQKPNSLHIVQENASIGELRPDGAHSLIVHTTGALDNAALPTVRDAGAITFDVDRFTHDGGKALLDGLRQEVKSRTFGKRRIQSLHETGQAGLCFGLHLYQDKNGCAAKAKPNVVVLGSGNVAMGAIDEAYRNGVRNLRVLTKRDTASDRIGRHLAGADVVVNGADPVGAVGRDRYLITKSHVATVMQKGAVIIDLIGGSETNRSPVESVVTCTFMTAPYFTESGVHIAAIWGWPMMGFSHQSTEKYSAQITDVLLGRERLIDGLRGQVAPGMKPAVVATASGGLVD